LARARFAYVRLLELGNGDYAWNRFFDYVNDRGFGDRGNWRLHGLRLSPRNLFCPVALSFGHTFFDLNLVAIRLAALPRTDLEDLRVLPRVVDFPLFPTVARFLR
jgi:hypothetical protein